MAELHVLDNTHFDHRQSAINSTLREIRDAIVAGNTGTGTIFGIHIDDAESDPANKVIYLKDAEGMTPMGMDYDNNRFKWGSWAKDCFLIPRPCMQKYSGEVDYYLDPDDYNYKISGEASDVANLDYEGNAMLEYGRDGKKIWMKIVPDDGDVHSASIYLADYQADEDFTAWPFYNANGVINDHFYVPCFNGYYDGTRMRSISGVTPSKSLTRAVERQYCRANGDGWDTEVFADNLLITAIVWMLGKSLDSQTVFGEGLHTGGTEAINAGFTTGVHNAKGLFYGTNSGTASTYANAVKVLGMENLWGYQWRAFGGLANVNGAAKYKLTRGTQDGSTASDYVVSTAAADYDGYLDSGLTFPANQSGTYISQMSFTKAGWFPTLATGTSASHYCDGLWTNNNQVDYPFRGGGSSNGARVGVSCLSVYNASSYAAWIVGAAPSCKPLP